MGMFMGQRPLAGGTFGARVMLSLDPLMGKGGYPLLFQTGESADGVHPLLDRQHPHDLFMELAATYSHPLTEQAGVFAYAGLPGEPALGPPAYMHRGSGADNPETPLSHHWLDSTHISYGVLTTGLTWDGFKVEGSAFNGREPDRYRWNIETGALNSSALRLSWNPAAAWSLQVSRGWLKSPEQLEPEVNVVRTTASAAYARSVADDGDWQATLAWGRNRHEHGGVSESSDAWLLESALHLGGRYTLFARAERVEEGELFPLGDPLYGPMYTVRKLTVGGIYDFARVGHVKLGVGGLVSGYDYPDALDTAYGSHPMSYLLFLRAKLD